jgi:hypothetical protein
MKIRCDWGAARENAIVSVQHGNVIFCSNGHTHQNDVYKIVKSCIMWKTRERERNPKIMHSKLLKEKHVLLPLKTQQK